MGPKGKVTDSGVRQAVQRRAGKAAIGHIHPHQLGHAFADEYLCTQVSFQHSCTRLRCPLHGNGRKGFAMHTRLVSFTGAKDIDGGIAFIRDKVVPILSQQAGYRGLTASADRGAGVLSALSLWETEANRDASDSAMGKSREEGHGIIGGELTVEVFELLVAEVDRPPVPGSGLLVTRISMDPAKVDENVAFFKNEVLPQIKAGPGFLALRNMVNRKTGQGVVGSAWANQDALKEAAAAAQVRRQQGVARNVTFGEVSLREIVVADLK